MKYKKNKKRIINGFTLVELLAVIVILAIIMIIAIPAVLDTMQAARRKTFVEFIQKVYTTGERKYIEDSSFGNISNYNPAYYVYSIQDDLGMPTTGENKGAFYIYRDGSTTYYIIIVYNKDMAFFRRVYDTDNPVDFDNLLDEGIKTRQDLLDFFHLPSNFNLDNADKNTIIAAIKSDFQSNHCSGVGTASPWAKKFKIFDAADSSKAPIVPCE